MGGAAGKNASEEKRERNDLADMKQNSNAMQNRNAQNGNAQQNSNALANREQNRKNFYAQASAIKNATIAQNNLATPGNQAVRDARKRKEEKRPPAKKPDAKPDVKPDVCCLIMFCILTYVRM
jgi:hypothetical protein